MKKHLLCLVPCLLTGCADLFSMRVDFSDQADAAIDLEVDITGPCAGTGTQEDDHGVSTWTKTLLGEGPSATCRIELTWDGDLISLAKMRADTIDSCRPTPDDDRCDPDELDLSLSITINAASFTAGPVVIVKEDLVAMSGRATTGAATLFEIEKATPLPLVLGPDPAVRDQLKTAYLVAGQLQVHAEGSVEIAMADVLRLQESAPTGMLHVELTSELSGGIDVSP